jgi:predicted lipoprotein
MLRHLAFAIVLATPAGADVTEAVNQQALQGYAAFSAATADLALAADGSCDAHALRPAYQAAFDAWMGVSHLRLGPVEEDGRVQAIAFWPDPKGAGKKVLANLMATKDPAVSDPAAFAEVSVAGRGLFALERLLYGDVSGEYACALTRAVAADLARIAAETEAGWTGGFAGALTTAGVAGNSQYLSPTEARQAMFTQLISGLEFDKNERLGRPLGTFDHPRPERAEAIASERSLRNVQLSLTALRQLSALLVSDAPKTDAAFDRALTLAEGLNDPVLAGVAEPQGWLKVQILQDAIEAVIEAASDEVGTALNVGVGFNAGDGD